MEALDSGQKDALRDIAQHAQIKSADSAHNATAGKGFG
jgi:hypothetical protein